LSIPRSRDKVPKPIGKLNFETSTSRDVIEAHKKNKTMAKIKWDEIKLIYNHRSLDWVKVLCLFSTWKATQQNLLQTKPLIVMEFFTKSYILLDGNSTGMVATT